ncbi:MAG: hypothetical protein D6805_08260 [Planctomycetota bacterium]|nr:MAG: hypothetical protein D6805_08260 [Planctomycetota bacterium]
MDKNKKKKTIGITIGVHKRTPSAKNSSNSANPKSLPKEEKNSSKNSVEISKEIDINSIKAQNQAPPLSESAQKIPSSRSTTSKAASLENAKSNSSPISIKEPDFNKQSAQNNVQKQSSPQQNWKHEEETVELELGKGLDVGTANLISAVQDKNQQLIIKTQRNAFIDIEPDDFTRNMLTKLNVQYVVINGKMVVIGDPAFELANIFNRNTRRPMADGLISPDEMDAMPIEKLLIENLLGPVQEPGEICYFSIPAEPIDADFNVVYHRGVFEGLLGKLGYTAKPIVEGHAVVFAELAEEEFTGIGISCGGGMFNICVAFKTIPALSFSTARGGDWIDKNVGRALGIKASKATAIKEKGVDIRNPKNREEEAVAIYYRELIRYTLNNIKKRFESSSDMPSFPNAIDIVFAGGTSLIGGFIDVVQDEFEKIKFPLEVKNIRRAEDPLHSVAKGCLVAAMADYS